MSEVFIGIDTSCYTTSCALLSEEGELLADERILIPVTKGDCGIAQNKAVFHHIRHMPDCLEKAFSNDAKIIGVCASIRPRPVEDSYMPVFVVGESIGRSLAASAGVRFYAVSHQEGHIEAAAWSARAEWDSFLAVHLSGGTTEVLSVRAEKAGYNTRILSACDLPAGQMIDRIGVALGLPFPAGPHLERLSEHATATPVYLPNASRGLKLSFSGPESAAQGLIQKGVDSCALASAVFDNIANSLSVAIRAAINETGLKRVLIMGGVAANKRIRRSLQGVSDEIRFADPGFTSDNAAGVALLGLRMFNAG